MDSATMPDGGIVRSLQAAASRAAVPGQWRRGRGGGNDAAVLWPQGIRTATVSVPCHCIHAPVSVLALADLTHAEMLLHAWLSGVGEGV